MNFGKLNCDELRFWMRRIAVVYYPHTRKFFSGLMIQELQQILTLKKCIISFIELKRNLNSSVQGQLKLGLSRTTRQVDIQRCDRHAFIFASRLTTQSYIAFFLSTDLSLGCQAFLCWLEEIDIFLQRHQCQTTIRFCRVMLYTLTAYPCSILTLNQISQ